QVDHVAPAAGDHARQHRAGAVDQALAVGVDHLVPVVQVGVLGRVQAEREAGVVHQQVYRPEPLRQRGDVRRDAVTVPDVKLHREDLPAELVLEILQPIRAAGGGDDARTVGGEPAGYCGAEAAARAGDEHDGWLAACHDYV